MIIELAMVAAMSQPNIELTKGVSGGRSSSRSISPKTSSPKSNSKQSQSQPKSNDSSKKQESPKKSSSTSSQSNNYSGKLSDSKKFNNRDGKQVVYRDSGTNLFTNWFLFGWIWYNADANDKCYDAQHKPITCEVKK